MRHCKHCSASKGKSGNESTWVSQLDGSFTDGHGNIAKEQDPPEKSQRISQGGEKVYSNINDPIERVFRWFVPREYKDPITGKTLEVDNDGYTVGSMLTGTPDLMGGFGPKGVSVLKKFSNNALPDVSLIKQLAGKGQLKDLRGSPNLKNVDIETMLTKTPRQIEEMYKGSSEGNKIIKQINKAFEGRDLGKQPKKR